MKNFLKSTRFSTRAYSSAILVITAFTLLATYSVQKATSYSYGVAGLSRSGCGGCHGGSSSATVVKIWTDASQIVVGKTYDFHLSVANPSEAGAGCDFSADNSAVLATSDPGLQLYKTSEITHNAPQSFSGDSAVWTFQYTPKKTGTSHIYAAGNAVNLNRGADGGDRYNLATYTMTVVSAAGPQAAFSAASGAVLRDTSLVGNTVTSTVWLHNKGTATLTINHYGLKTGTVFTLLDTSARSIAAGDSAAISIAFNPASKGSFTDSLRVWSNDVAANPGGMALSGVGTVAKLQVDNASLAFGSVRVSSSMVQHGKITNGGNGPLTIASITVSSPSGAFKFVGLAKGALPPLTLSPSGSTADTFSFVPAKVGPDTAIVTIQFAETATPRDTTIMLIGEGIQNAAVASSQPTPADLVIAPNPSNGRIVLRTAADLGNAELEISDAAGRVVSRESVGLAGETPLDLSSEPNGSYFVLIQPKGGVAIVRRIVIAR